MDYPIKPPTIKFLTKANMGCVNQSNGNVSIQSILKNNFFFFF